MKRFEDTLVAINEFCKKHSLTYTVVGGLAVITHGFPRTTQDIDVIVSVELEEIHTLGERLMTTFTPLKENPIEFLERYFVMPTVYQPTKVLVDFSAGLSGFEKSACIRSRRVSFGNVDVPIITIEDLIIFKLVASRHLDLADVNELFVRHSETIDRSYLRSIAKQFALLERSDVAEKVEDFCGRFL